MDAARNRESDAVHAWMAELGEMKGSENIRATGRIAADKQHKRVNPNREVINLWLVESVIVVELRIWRGHACGGYTISELVEPRVVAPAEVVQPMLRFLGVHPRIRPKLDFCPSGSEFSPANRVAGEVTLPWLSHHRAYGSVPRRFLS